MLVNNHIHSHGPPTMDMNVLYVNRSNTKYCIRHDGMITWNSLPDVYKVNLTILFDVQEQGTKFLSIKIL